MKNRKTVKNENTYNSNITKEDLNIIGTDIKNNLRQDAGDDLQLKNRIHEVDFTGSNLDVPTKKESNNKESSALDDEENRLHSQGSASNENLEEQSSQYTV